jgi:hypothetical protein
MIYHKNKKARGGSRVLTSVCMAGGEELYLLPLLN